MNKHIRVRYAPSPTGQLHIGGARTALFNYLFAKKHKGTFIVRIEDTDLKRNIKNGERSQIENLEWMGLTIDESPRHEGQYGPYRQSERIAIYQKHAEELLEKGKAYKCYCTPEELAAEREAQIKAKIAPKYSGKCRGNKEDKGEGYTIRLRVDNVGSFEWEDMVRGHVMVEAKDVSDWVIIKKDGIATYNFAVVIDDHLMKISHVIRGEDHLTNTAKQIHLYQTLCWRLPTFGHITLITNSEGKKLSKRDDSVKQFIEMYKEDGFLPEAVCNYMSLLGWAPGGEEEIFSLKQLGEIFDEKRFSKSSSFFDIEKLKWTNSVYIKDLTDEEYLKFVTPFAEKTYSAEDFSTNKNKQILLLFKKELKVGNEIGEKVKIFFDKYKHTGEVEELITVFKEEVAKSNKWDIETVGKIFKTVQTATGKKGKEFFMPIRMYYTGQEHGPDLKTVVYLLEDK